MSSNRSFEKLQKNQGASSQCSRRVFVRSNSANHVVQPLGAMRFPKSFLRSSEQTSGQPLFAIQSSNHSCGGPTTEDTTTSTCREAEVTSKVKFTQPVFDLFMVMNGAVAEEEATANRSVRPRVSPSISRHTQRQRALGSCTSLNAFYSAQRFSFE